MEASKDPMPELAAALEECHIAKPWRFPEAPLGPDDIEDVEVEEQKWNYEHAIRFLGGAPMDVDPSFYASLSALMERMLARAGVTKDAVLEDPQAYFVAEEWTVSYD